MAGGLAQAQASSAAFATMGSQAEIALNSGWILDQRDNAGSFLTNASPTSSGLRFLSTGDATAFYVSGRAIRVVQGVQSAVCTVGLSSFAAGITTVFINQFSTAGSTVLTTGAITSVQASPILGDTVGSGYGGFYVIPTTGGNPSVAIGAAAAAAGIFRVPNNNLLAARNAANTLDIGLMYVDGSNNLLLGQAGTAAPTLIGMQAPLTLGTTPASSGALRLTNSAIAIVGKTSTGGDDVVWPTQFSTTTLSADIASSGQNFTTIITKTLGVGTWAIGGSILAASTNITTDVVARLHDGTNTLASAQITSLSGGSTSAGASLYVSAIVSHSTALAYNLQLGANSTTVKARANTELSTINEIAATWFTAVKIG